MEIIMKSSSRKEIFALAAVVLMMYAVFTAALLMSHREPSYDISHIEPDTEYMDIHETGGLAGINDHRLIYEDGGRFYMEYTGKERMELSKAEYLLCTSFDRDYLDRYAEPLASDMFYYEITLKSNGTEEIIPRKAYDSSSIGLSAFVRQNRDILPVGNIGYDTFINAASYLYLHDVKLSYLIYGTPERDYPLTMMIRNADGQGSDFFDIYRQLDGKCRKVMRYADDKDISDAVKELFAECESTELFGKPAYYRELVGSDAAGFFITSPSDGEYIIFVSETPDDIADAQLLNDMLYITAGIKDRSHIYTFAAGSAVFIMLFVIPAAAVYRHKKTAQAT